MKFFSVIEKMSVNQDSEVALLNKVELTFMGVCTYTCICYVNTFNGLSICIYIATYMCANTFQNPSLRHIIS